MARITLDIVKGEMKNVGWKVVSEEYTNLKTNMKFRCPEGHLVETTWEKMRSRQNCPICQQNVKIKISDISASRKTEEKRVLALDQASYDTGWSVYDGTTLVAYGLFQTHKKESILRVLEVCDWLASMIYNWKPDFVGIEDIQYNPKGEIGGVGNHNTFKLLGQLMGALMLTIIRAKKDSDNVNNKVWKSHCGVKGRTRMQQKASAQGLVKKWYDITVPEDVSDAICIGRYFAETRASQEKAGIGDY